MVAVDGKTLFEAKWPLTGGGGAVIILSGTAVVEDKIWLGVVDVTTTFDFELLSTIPEEPPSWLPSSSLKTYGTPGPTSGSLKSANHGGNVALKTFHSPDTGITEDSVVVVVGGGLVVVVVVFVVVVVGVVVVLGRLVNGVVAFVVVDIGLEEEENRGGFVVDNKNEGS